jgi:hypothetical protein
MTSRNRYGLSPQLIGRIFPVIEGDIYQFPQFDRVAQDTA